MNDEDSLLNLLHFSDELLEQILLCPVIAVQELGQLCQTCKRLNSVISSNELWKQKLFHRWPYWYHSLPSKAFRYTFKRRTQSDLFVAKEVAFIMKESYHMRNIPNNILKNIFKFSDSRDSHILESLNEITNDTTGKQLDRVYFGKKVYSHVIFHHNTSNLLQLITESSRGTNSCYGGVMQGISLITEIYKPHVLVQNKVHFDTSKIEAVAKDIFPFLKDIPTYDMEKARQCLEDWNSFLLKDCHLNDTVLHLASLIFFGHPSATDKQLLSCCFYLTISENLGLNMKLINLNGCYVAAIDTKTGVLYVDVWQNGRILSEKQCLTDLLFFDIERSDIQLNFLKVLEMEEIFIRVIGVMINLHRVLGQMNGMISDVTTLQRLFELSLAISPDGDDNDRLFLARLYLHQGFNTDLTIEHLETLLARGNLPTESITTLLEVASLRKASESADTEHRVNLRSDDENSMVEFKIGMVMKHKRFDYGCVIYGWDNFCDMPENWQNQMGIANLTNGADQPYYNVLAHDGSTRYAAQESLMVHPSPHPIVHDEIGKHFSTYEYGRYLATEMLLRIYPEDYTDSLFFQKKVEELLARPNEKHEEAHYTDLLGEVSSTMEDIGFEEEV